MELLDAVDAEGIPLEQLPPRVAPIAKLRQVKLPPNSFQ